MTGTVTGSGTLTLNGGAFQLGSSVASTTQTITLAALGNFTFNVPTADFTVGGTSNATSPANGILTLGINNVITALSFNAGHFNGSSLPGTSNTGTINLGQTNVVNADAVNIGDMNKSLGTLVFQALDSPTLRIRATDGIGRANMIVGQNGSGTNSPGGVVDLTLNLANSSNSSLDALLGTLLIGNNNRGTIAGTALGAFGSFTMGGGILDATAITIGRDTSGSGTSSGGSVANGSFTLGIAGGVAGGTVKVSTLTLGDQNGTSTITATFNLNTGGTLAAQTIQPGAGDATRTINWNDGTISTFDAATNLAILAGPDLKLATDGIHTFSVGTGLTATVDATLSDATGGGTLNKTGSGTLILTNANTYTGSTTIAAGTVSLGGSGSIANSSIIVVGTTPGSTAVLHVNALTGGANFNGTSFTLAAGQTLAGHGTVNASTVGFVAPAGTTLAPGTSVGTLSIIGNSTLGGVYQFELATAGVGSTSPVANGFSSPPLPHLNHDFLAITGAADVTNLVINISSIDLPGTGFDNTKNYSWTILTANSLTGTPTLGAISGLDFNNPGDGTFSLATNSTSIYLNFSQPLPEPGLLLFVGISALFAVRSIRCRPACRPLA